MSFDVVVSKLEKFEEKIDGICSKINNIDKNLGLLKQHVEIQNGRIKKNEVKIEELMYKLLDINTEIDPVATALDSTDPENIIIQIRTTLRITDLQDSEIIAEVMGLIEALSDVFNIVK